MRVVPFFVLLFFVFVSIVYADHSIYYSLRDIDLSAISTLSSLEDVLAAGADTLRNIRLLRLSLALYQLTFTEDVYLDLSVDSPVGAISCSSSEAPVVSCIYSDCNNLAFALPDEKTSASFIINVDNYDTCGALVMSTTGIGMYIVDPYSGSVIYDSSEDNNFVSYNFHGVCCDEIRTQIPSWNGTMQITVTDLLSADAVQFSLFDGQYTRIPYKNFYTLAMPQITCGGTELSWKPSTVVLDTLSDTETVLLYYPPYFDSFAISRVNNTQPYRSDILNFALVVRGSETNIRSYKTATFWRDFNYKQCQFRFQNLVYSDGRTVEQTVVPSPLDLSSSCDIKKFIEIGQYVQNAASLDSSNLVEGVSVSVQLTSLIESAEYLSCLHLLENSYGVYVPSRRSDENCSKTSFYDPDHYDEPCCRATGSVPGQFCKPRSYVENILQPNNSTIEATCSNIDCSYEYAQTYFDILQPDSVVDECDSEFDRSLQKFQDDDLEVCEMYVYGMSCLSSEKCVESMGRNSICYEGRCVRLCTTDSSCYPGTCDVSKSICELYGDGVPLTNVRSSSLYGTAHKTEVGEHLVLECVVKSLTEKNLIGGYIELLGIGTDNILNDFKSAFLIDNQCVGSYWLANEYYDRSDVLIGQTNNLQNFVRSFSLPRPDSQAECLTETCNWIPTREYDLDLTDCTAPELGTHFCGDRFYPFMEFSYGDITTNRICYISNANETTCPGTWEPNFKVFVSSNETQALCIANDTTYCNYRYPGFSIARSRCFLNSCTSGLSGYGETGETLCPTLSYDTEATCVGAGGTWTPWIYLTTGSYSEELCPHSSGPGYCFGRPTDRPSTSKSTCDTGLCVGYDSFNEIPDSTGVSPSTCLNNFGECFSFLTNTFTDLDESDLDTLTGVCRKSVSWESVISVDDCGTEDDWYLDPTKKYCVSYSLSVAGESVCTANSMEWSEIPSTREICEAYVACYQNISGEEVTLAITREQCIDECEGCSWRSVYTWTRGYFAYPWFSTTSTWQPRGTIQNNSWITLIDTDYYNSISAGATLAALTRRQKSNIACKFNRLHVFAEHVLCDCSNDCASNTGFTSIPISFQEICAYSLLQGDNYITENEFQHGKLMTWSNITFTQGDVFSPCVTITIDSISFRELDGFDIIPIQTVDLSPRIQRLRTKGTVITTPTKLVIGQASNDLLLLKPEKTIGEGLIICLKDEFYDIQNLDESLRTEDFLPELRKTVSIAPYTGELGTYDWTILDFYPYVVPGHICGEVNREITASSPIIFAPTYTFISYEKRGYFDNLGVFDRILDIVMAMLYVVVFILCAINFHLHVKFHDRRNRVFWTLPKLGLLFLLIFQFIRFVYHILVLFEFLQNSPVLIFVFSEFAALVYYSVCAITVLRWAEIYHFSMSSKGTLDKVMPIYLIINGLLVLAFLVVLLIYAVLSGTASTFSSCTGLDKTNEYSTLEGVTIFYKIYFASICLLLVVSYVVYTLGLRKKLTNCKKITKGSIPIELILARYSFYCYYYIAYRPSYQFDNNNFLGHQRIVGKLDLLFHHRAHSNVYLPLYVQEKISILQTRKRYCCHWL
eukprot:TRINITY_DN4539_c0_g1_i2.p1 TRINITY_DN4539_c0_g1~~TRINITY_DN4539_c0_g1_i2.p1  ORF type:complete len:1576 (+),score=218.12 TRINITY_DN4539_c0_g1_i2:112-4839(+)